MKFIKFILLFLFFVSCQESKTKKNAQKNELKIVTKEYDFSDSMQFKFEEIATIEVYSFLNKAMVEIYKNYRKDINFNSDVQMSNDFIKEKATLFYINHPTF